MTRTEQERLVERYLNSEMSSADEQEFFIQVAVDSNLRQTLKAYRIVESALRKHRDAASSQHAEGRARVIAALQAASVVHAGSSGVTPAGAAPMISRSSNRTWLSSAMFKWIFMVVLAIGFTAAYIVASDVDRASENSTLSSDALEQMNGTAGAPVAPAAEAENSPAPPSGPSDDVTTASSAAPPQESGRTRDEDREVRHRTAGLPSSSSSRTAGTDAAGRPRSSARQVMDGTPAGVDESDGVPSSRAAVDPVVISPPAIQPDEPAIRRSGKDTLKISVQIATPQQRK